MTQKEALDYAQHMITVGAKYWETLPEEERKPVERFVTYVLDYDKLCREALEKRADIEGLFAIDAREKIGRAKMAAADRFGADYDAIIAEMRQQIEAVVAGGEEE